MAFAFINLLLGAYNILIVSRDGCDSSSGKNAVKTIQVLRAARVPAKFTVA
jgi:hypothetical protein